MAINSKRVILVAIAALFCSVVQAETSEVMLGDVGTVNPAAKAKGDKYPSKNEVFSIKPARSPFLDTKQAVYQYDPNASYPIVSRSNQNTQIDLPDGLTVNGFYLSDPSDENWVSHVSPDKKHIFIQPLQGGLFNSASIIAGNHTFLLAITSADEGQWFQRVKWTLPKKYQVKDAKAAAVEADKEKSGKFYENYDKHEDRIEPIKGVDADHLNTNWKIEGEAPFKPTSVYNDQDSTWIVMPEKMPEMPVLFAISPSGELDMVNYTLTESGRYKVNKVLYGAVLKIDKQEVKLTNLRDKRQKESKVFSFFGIK